MTKDSFHAAGQQDAPVPQGAGQVDERIDAILLAAGTTGKKQVWFTREEAASAVRAALSTPIQHGGEAPDIGMLCPTAPERIWLQIDPEPEEEGKPVYPPGICEDDVTWCWDKINESDTLYIRADLAVPRADVSARKPVLPEGEGSELIGGGNG